MDNETQFFSMIGEADNTLGPQSIPNLADGLSTLPETAASGPACDDLNKTTTVESRPLLLRDSERPEEHQPSDDKAKLSAPLFEAAADQTRIIVKDKPGESRNTCISSGGDTAPPVLPSAQPQHIKTHIDRFFGQLGPAGAPSPIKPSTDVSDSQETLDLRLDRTYITSKCIQSNDSDLSFDQLDVNILEDQPVGFTEDEPIPCALVSTAFDADPANPSENKENKMSNSGKEKDDLSAAANGDGDSGQSAVDAKDKEAHSRKRNQTQMEPAAFEIPRATKFPHKDLPTFPEFRGDSPPLIDFSAGHEDVFVARLSSNDHLCVQNVQSFEDMSVQEVSANLTDNVARQAENDDASKGAKSTSEHGHVRLRQTAVTSSAGRSVEGDAAGQKQPPPLSDSVAAATTAAAAGDGGRSSLDATVTADPNKTAADFNRTLDMTLRTSGVAACGLGLLLAFDEMLDPAMRPLLPYGMRRRGANIVIFATSLTLASFAWWYAF